MRKRRTPGGMFKRPKKQLPKDDKTRSIFETISSKDLKAAMEKAWNGPLNHSRFKARWRP